MVLYVPYTLPVGNTQRYIKRCSNIILEVAATLLVGCVQRYMQRCGNVTGSLHFFVAAT